MAFLPARRGGLSKTDMIVVDRIVGRRTSRDKDAGAGVWNVRARMELGAWSLEQRGGRATSETATSEGHEIITTAYLIVTRTVLHRQPPEAPRHRASPDQQLAQSWLMMKYSMI